MSFSVTYNMDNISRQVETKAVIDCYISFKRLLSLRFCAEVFICYHLSKQDPYKLFRAVNVGSSYLLYIYAFKLCKINKITNRILKMLVKDKLIKNPKFVYHNDYYSCGLNKGIYSYNEPLIVTIFI